MLSDLNLLRSVATVFCLLAFVGIVVWAYLGRQTKDFDAAARLPFEQD